ncbi:MAG: L,D-transpeptidase [Verrucomicrobia bacterium]|nr:L,D-transpeptidase [Verrucomicrobiota bacterium]
MNAILRIGFCLLLAALAGCTTYDRRLTSSTTRYLTSGGDVVAKPSSAGIIDTVSYWDGDGVSGRPSITIDLGEQKTFFYKDGRLVGVSMISSGREGYRTPPGQYKVLQKSKDHVSNLYGDYVDQGGNLMVANVGVKRDPKPPGAKFRGAPMPYFLRFHGGYGLHAGFLPGFAASHGCVRMPERMAQIFFANVSPGTPVRVVE